MQGCLIVQRIIALDMEGVVTPEIWIAVATHTGLPELRLTTRDEPDYQKLMEHRISILSANGIGLALIREVISTLKPLEGAKDFLDQLRRDYQVIILSDTFEQFAGHLMKELGYPHLLCHDLTLEMDRVVEFVARTDDAKRKAVESYQGLGYHVTAVGDSHNDLGMLQQADAGCLFRAAEGLPEKYPMLPCLEAYDELRNWIDTTKKT
jgi:phosphoserine/homoserine phosphotransferase